MLHVGFSLCQHSVPHTEPLINTHQQETQLLLWQTFKVSFDGLMHTQHHRAADPLFP